MIKKKINYFENPPKITSAVSVDSASIVRQTYNMLTGEYYPDRGLFPLVLTPIIGYMDTRMGGNEGVVENAARELVDGHWYRLDNSTTKETMYSREITDDGKTYTIDTTVGSATYGRLISKENVEPSNPVTYLFTAILNKGGGYKVSAYFSLDSVTISVNPVLSFDNDRQGMWNPWDADMPRLFKIHPVVTPSELPATFKWLYEINGVWEPLGSSPEHWAVEADGDGVVIDRKVMPQEIALKCVATVDVNGYETEVEAIVTHHRRLPAFESEIGGVADLNQGTTSIHPQALIQTGRKIIADTGEEVSVNWYGTGTTPIATGLNPQIYVSSLGENMELGLDVSDNGGYKAWVDDDGDYIADDDGTLIIVK